METPGDRVWTSETHPILVKWASGPIPPSMGRIGITFAPGKKDRSLSGVLWRRDLAADLDRLAGEYGIRLLVSLVLDAELDLLAIPDLVQTADARGIEVLRIPVRDGSIPTFDQADRATRAAIERAASGQNAAVHCRGGLGRAGTIAACCLVRLGMPARAAVERVRERRPGAIETTAQEYFVTRFLDELEWRGQAPDPLPGLGDAE